MNQSSNQPVGTGETRRSFLRKAATAAAVVAATNPFKTPVYGQTTAPSVGAAGANNKINLGLIGCGPQGFNSHLKNIMLKATDNNVALIAACDVSKTRLAAAVKEIGDPNAKGYEDYKEMLARKDIDAIFCATVDHWHARVAIDALNAGKHAYVEKPMARYLPDAFEVREAVKKTGKILQVGSQDCSDPKWHEAAKLIKSGKLGPIVMSQGSYMRNTPKGEWNQYKIEPWAQPSDVNWQSWLGPIKKKKDFDPEDFFRWRKYYRYCAGILGDLLPHKLHPYMLATGNPEFPSRVAAIGTRKVLTDKNMPDTRMRDCSEILQLIAEFPSGGTMHITCSTVSEYGPTELIRCHKAYLVMGGNKVELKPEKPFSDDIDPESLGPFAFDRFVDHHRNFFQSIRENKVPNCNVELATRVQTVVSLAELSERLQIMCLFDEKTNKITTADGKEVKPLTFETETA
jgi:predicted dehydrogenase